MKGHKQHVMSVPEPLANRLQAYAFRHGLSKSDKFFKRRIQPFIPRREWPKRQHRPGRPPQAHQVSKHRWKVERSNGWLDDWWRLVARYDWHTESYITFLIIACFMLTLSKILG
jgi:transposase